MGLPECRKAYEAIPASKREPAIAYLRKHLAEKEKIRRLIKKDSVNWCIPYHLTWGMTVRNKLRGAGFGEEYFNIGNLDDIYVELVEDAVRV